MAVALNFFFSFSPALSDILFAGKIFTRFCCCCGFSAAETVPGWLSRIFRDESDTSVLESPRLAETEFDSDTAGCFKGWLLFCIWSFDDDNEAVFLLPPNLITLRSMLMADTGGFSLSCTAPRDELGPIMRDPASSGLDCRGFALKKQTLKQSRATLIKFTKNCGWSSSQR